MGGKYQQMKENYKVSFELFCSLTDAMKLTNLQLFVALKKDFFLKDKISQKQ